MLSPRATKSSMRCEVLARVAAMTARQRADQDAALAGRLANLPGFDRAETVLLYASGLPGEVDTWPMLRLALDLGRRLVCPRIVGLDRPLVLHEVAELDRDLVPGYRGLREPSEQARRVEPAEVDWVLVPGVAFDRSGFRLGRGAGHYDRLLAELRPEVSRWSLIYDAQWVDRVPTEPHDRPVDGVADSSEVIDLRRPDLAR